MKLHTIVLSAGMSLTLMTGLAGCGGGGGGGGDPVTLPPETTTETETETPYSQRQNTYLPLVADAGIAYSVIENDGSAIIEAVAETTTLTGVSSPYLVSMGEVGFYYTSTPTEAGFYGFSGAFTISVGGGFTARINSLVFSEAIPLWRDSYTDGDVITPSLTQAVVNATVYFGGIPVSTSNVTLTIDAASITPQGKSTISTDYGVLQAQRVDVAVAGSGTINETPFTVDYTDTVHLAKGLGVISRQTLINYNGATFYESSQTMNHVINLPKPLRYLNTGGTVTLASSDSVVEFDEGSALSRTDYRMLNGDAVPWLGVEEVAGDQFGVSPNGTSPSSDEGAEVFYLQRRSGATDHLPLHITLAAPPSEG